MTTLEMILSVTNALSGIGWLKTYRDNRSIDVSFWKETIEYQNKIIEEQRIRLNSLEKRIQEQDVRIAEQNKQITELKKEIEDHFPPPTTRKRTKNGTQA